MTSSSGDWTSSSGDWTSSSVDSGALSSISEDSFSSLISGEGAGVGAGSGLLDGGGLDTSFLEVIGLGAFPNMSFGTALDRRRFCTR